MGYFMSSKPLFSFGVWAAFAALLCFMYTRGWSANAPIWLSGTFPFLFFWRVIPSFTQKFSFSRG